MTRITLIALVAIVALGIAGSTAWAGEVGFVEINPESSPAPDMPHLILYGETAGDFLEIYSQALENGFVWLTAPVRTYVRQLGAEVWMVLGYMVPDRALQTDHGLPSEGRVESDGRAYDFQVIAVSARTADELILQLQQAFELRLGPVSLLRYRALGGGDGPAGWTIDLLLVLPAEEESVSA